MDSELQMVAFEVVELHSSTLSDKKCESGGSITFVGNALTMHAARIIRMHFDISKLVTSSNVINFSLRHRKLNMASLKSMTAKMKLQLTPRVRQCCDS